ncbi:TIGR03564 family F420-dependent LLM class oxidoreductase [Amycolatopsis thermophila]|uniref:F420-dependent oxidoreductase-like protein n=1 Tax=Amycolatopsis thermophila TaxID=206084 RepID=A0ABU0EM89_9PSEU|nr:TIGR03564 family F420-dependent LLM class oxidoreductase [Amycolatopsis thermophila]MDQ0376135.1 F420-dependent oxidoreductase-like protein [Amycolatopsis thermophila]
MRIGLHLSSTGPLDAFPREAAAARHLDSAWTNQQPGGWDPLALLPHVDGPPELGTAVVPTYPRHPVVMATEALTVQALTGGRLTLGIGPSHEHAITGWWGIPYTKPASHTREYLEVLRPLLRGDHVKYSGEFFTVDHQLAVTAPPPPVLIAALGPRMLGIARDLADGTIGVWLRPDTVESYLVPRLGENQRVAVVVMVALTGDPDATRERIARDFAIVGELPAYRAVLDRGGLRGPADTVVAGDEAQVLRELRRFRDAGVTDLIISPLTARERLLEVALEAR